MDTVGHMDIELDNDRLPKRAHLLLLDTKRVQPDLTPWEEAKQTNLKLTNDGAHQQGIETRNLN